jgi:predicted transcriptional regulator
MSQTNPPARPQEKRSEKRIRTFQTCVRLNREEDRQLKRIAKAAKTSRQWVVRALLMDLKLEPVQIYPEETYRAIIELGRNFNEAVKTLHITGEFPPESVQRLLSETKELRGRLCSK